MKIRGMIRGTAGLAALAATFAAGATAQAATFTAGSACSAPAYAFSQPFAPWGDTNSYTLAPGQAVNAFGGEGWTLTGGARIVTTTLANGSTGTVLDLPAGAKAVSPPMCVSSGYPTVRMKVRDVVGAPSVHLYVAYTSTPSWDQPAAAGVATGTSTWGNSQILQAHPGNLYGWQYVKYTLAGGVSTQHAQLYNFYVDPRSMW